LGAALNEPKQLLLLWSQWACRRQQPLHRRRLQKGKNAVQLVDAGTDDGRSSTIARSQVVFGKGLL